MVCTNYIKVEETKLVDAVHAIASYQFILIVSKQHSAK
jgi:hypothetical protein